MAMNRGVLHLLCGKIAAGKSILTATLGAAPEVVVISEDAWLPRRAEEGFNVVLHHP